MKKIKFDKATKKKAGDIWCQRSYDEMIDFLADVAARRIEALEAENRRMREALRLIASCERRAEGDVVDIARAVLEGEKP